MGYGTPISVMLSKVERNENFVFLLLPGVGERRSKDYTNSVHWVIFSSIPSSLCKTKSAGECGTFFQTFQPLLLRRGTFLSCCHEQNTDNEEKA